MNDTRAVSSYFRRLERALECPKAVRRPFLERTRRMAEDLLRDSPEAGGQELTGLLGEPRELAQGFLETLDPEILMKHRRRKKLFRRGLAALAVAIIICLGIWVYYLWAHQLNIEVTKTLVIYKEEPL